MEKIKYYIKKYKIIIILLFSLISFLFIIIFNIKNSKEIEKEEIIDNSTKMVEQKQEKLNKIKVDIKGFVKKPGVYEFVEGARVIDVINIAGGLKEDANTEYINLSKKIYDEMIIIIYSNNEIEKFRKTEPNKEIIYIKYECECPDNINDSCITSEDVVNTNGVQEKEESNKDLNKDNNDEKENNKEEKTDEKTDDKTVSINSATTEELMTLSGIGESKAKAIIEYREQNNGFKKLEDLMNVSGIGEKAYSKIKDYIKL